MSLVHYLHRVLLCCRRIAGRQVPQDRQAAAQQDVVAEHADEDHHRHRGPGPHPGHLPPSASQPALAPCVLASRHQLPCREA